MMTRLDTVLYEVTLHVDPTLASELEDHMRRDHIPAIFRTGCFRRIRFDATASGTFRTCYQADTQEDLDRYLRDHAPRLRAEFQARFPRGVTLSREIWRPHESWEIR
jgi:hypothetical protein